jgi:hypothetical protein
LSGLSGIALFDPGSQPGKSRSKRLPSQRAIIKPMVKTGSTHPVPDIVLSDEPMHPAPAPEQAFDGNSTTHFQAKMNKAPVWFCSFLASNKREKHRFRDELVHMKGAWPLLMKQRNGGKWTPEDKVRLKAMVRSASSVSPYLFIWAIPGSMILLPFLAWFLDRQRKSRESKSAL